MHTNCQISFKRFYFSRCIVYERKHRTFNRYKGHWIGFLHCIQCETIQENCWVNTRLFGQIDDIFTIKHRDYWLGPISEKRCCFHPIPLIKTILSIGQSESLFIVIFSFHTKHRDQNLLKACYLMTLKSIHLYRFNVCWNFAAPLVINHIKKRQQNHIDTVQIQL